MHLFLDASKVQFSKENNRRRGVKGFKTKLVLNFIALFTVVRVLWKNAIKEMWERQMKLGTVLNSKPVLPLIQNKDQKSKIRTKQGPVFSFWSLSGL